MKPIDSLHIPPSLSPYPSLLLICLSFSVAINLIVQHIQDILNGDLCKWQHGGVVNGHSRGIKRAFSEQGDLDNATSNLPLGKRVLLEPSSRPH